MVLSPERWPYLSGRVALFSRTDGTLRPEFTTSKADSPLAECADAVIIIPGRVKQDSAAGSIQLLSSLFDQCTHIALDALCLMLAEREKVSDADAGKRHTNLE